MINDLIDLLRTDSSMSKLCILKHVCPLINKYFENKTEEDVRRRDS